MHRHSVVLLLILAACTPRPMAKSTAQQTFEKDMAVLLQESNKTRESCEKSASQLEDYLKSHAPDGVFKTKEHALRVLAMLKSHPGTPEATLKIADRTMNEAPRAAPGAEDWDTTSLLTANFCKPTSFTSALKTLIASANPLHLDRGEKSQIVDFTLTTAKRELSVTSGIAAVMNQMSLLLSLLDEKLIAPSDPMFVELVRMDKESGDIKSDVASLASRRDIPDSYRDTGSIGRMKREFLNEIMLGELDKVDTFRKKLRRFLDRISAP